MPEYTQDDRFQHDAAQDAGEPVGVLVSNLGSPDAPTPAALRRYLREFLSDPRVIEIPRWRWKPILELFVLPFRPRESAKLYAEVWTDEGSPLIAIGRRQREGIEQRLRDRFEVPVHVALGMRYGRPSIEAALEELRDAGCRRIVVLPLYPQYFAGTTATTLDAVAAALSTWRWVPELRTVNGYHDDPAYIEALAASIREREPADKLLFSFHGIPERYFLSGDPYFCLCHKTARLTAEALGLADDRWIVTFQSLFGREEWLKPYTDKTVEALARSGVRSIQVVCPGFSADCLETLEEIDGLNRKIFLEAGGERFDFVPCLNERPDHLDLLADVVEANLGGWLEGPARPDPVAAARRDGMVESPPTADAGFGEASVPMRTRLSRSS